MCDQPTHDPSPERRDVGARPLRDALDDGAPPGDLELLTWAGRLARFGGWYVEVKSGRVHWSDEVCAIHEVPENHVVTVEEGISFYHPEDRPVIGEAYRRCVTRGEPWDLELRMITAKGRERWVNTIGEPVRDTDGRISLVRGAYQDVTRRRLAEQRAAELEHRHTAILENMQDAFITVDRDWRFTFVNAEALRLFERRRDEVEGKVCWEVFPEAMGTHIEHESRRAMAVDSAYYFEARLTHRDIWVSVKTYPTEDGLAAYFRDITKQRSRVRLLAEQASLLQRATDAIVVWDADHRVTFWNAAATEILRWTPSEAVGRDVLELLGLDRAQVEAAHMELARIGDWTGELVATSRAGKGVLLDARWTLLSDDVDDDGTRVLAINTDVTEREQLRRRYLRAQRMESVGEMAGGIAHDLNNILTPILISARNVRDEIAAHPGTSVSECLDTIETCTERGTALLNRILSFVRGAELDPERLDLRGPLDEVVGVIRETFPRRIRIESEVDEDLWVVDADPTQLHQVLMNLCVNARDAIEGDGHLVVHAENVEVEAAGSEVGDALRAGRYAVISVSDTGAGMDPDTLERAFDPFFTTKDSGDGTGLGLATVDAIVRSHDGFVRADSRVGEGSRIRVYLPACSGRDGSESAMVRSALPAAARADDGSDWEGRGETILVVDDEELIVTGVARLLEASGYRVHTARNGADALEIFARHRDDICAIVLDVMMPVMGGVDTIREIRQIDAAIPVIATTGLVSEPKRQDLNAAGVAEIVLKPYRIETLLSLLSRELDDRKRRSA